MKRTRAGAPREKRVTIPGLHRDLRGDDLVTTRGSTDAGKSPVYVRKATIILDDRWFRAPSGSARTRSGSHLAFNPTLAPELFAHEAQPASPVDTRADEPEDRPRRTRSSDQQDPDLPEIGAIIDKYRIEALIGIGGFAAVYRATHLMLRMPVAIKMLRPSVMRRRPGLAATLCEEARFAARIDHPNVVRVFDVTHLPKITYIVMEYIEGSTLAKLLRESEKPSIRRAVQVGLDVARGLDAGLDQGLVHRDIKPENIMVTRNGSAKIVDLGLAQSNALSSSASTSGASTDEPAARSAMVGTHGYIPPDWGASRAGLDFRADIYALGVTLYHAAVGSPPFPTEDVERCMRMHREDPVPDPRSRRPELPPALSDLLLRMLAKKAADRPQSYLEINDALSALLSTLPADPERPR